MNFRVTLVLLGVLAALVVALVLGRDRGSEPEKGAEQLGVFDLKIADIQRLKISRGQEIRLFEKSKGGDWTLLPGRQRADTAKIEALLTRLANLRGLRRIPAAEADPAGYGLANPGLQVEIGLKDGASHGLRIGDRTPVRTGYYSQAAQGADVYVVASIVVADLERLFDQPLPPTPTPAPAPTATRVPTPASTAPPIGAPTPSPKQRP